MKHVKCVVFLRQIRNVQTKIRFLTDHPNIENLTIIYSNVRNCLDFINKDD